MTNVKVNTVLT